MSQDSEKPRYIQIPKCWNQKIWTNTHGALEKTISFGVVIHSKRIEHDVEVVAKRLDSDYHLNLDNLAKGDSDYMKNLIKAKEFEPDEYFKNRWTSERLLKPNDKRD